MNTTKQALLAAILASNTDEGVVDEDMQKACERNEFYVDAVPLFGGGYSIGAIDDTVPALLATREEAQLEIDYVKGEHKEQISEGIRDEDDEYEAELFRATISGDNEISLLPANKWDGDAPVWTGDLKLAMGA
jgi:hypothetical protein